MVGRDAAKGERVCLGNQEIKSKISRDQHSGIPPFK
jgi:hypothetical protein